MKWCKMGPYWLPMLGCLCVLASPVFSAAVPTPDTMVVARSDNGESSTTPTPPTTEVVTEEPSPPLKLTEMEVSSNIALRYAHTAVVTTVRNPAHRSQEATFRVLLPETAFISGFTMILDGKPYKAYVKEKDEAKQIYNQAVSAGIGAAHIATKARDSNHFTVSVNVEPNTVAVFNLTYEELLVRRNGVYNHAINLHPGALVPKLTVTVHIKEAQKITALRVPEVRTGNEIDASPEDPQNANAVIERGEKANEATITFKPDLKEQQRLIDIYTEKTKESRTPSYSYGYDQDDDKSETEGVLGQFVVQYDVDRPKNGEILVNDGYFVHFYAPSDLPPLNKHVVFVLDTSGSMMDRKIVQLREAMQTILGELNPGDYFNIVEFASSVMVHELKEADAEPTSPHNQYLSFTFSEYNKPARLVPPSPATPMNVAKAKVIVSRLQAAGGTNIYSALDVAVELINKGIGWTLPTNSSAKGTTESPVTGSPVEEKATTEVQKTGGENTEETPKLEPIIIFLTDGDPTVGETDPTRIINHLTEKNSGVNRATIFSLAFGEDADRKFLRKLSLRNDGFMRHIYEAADAALQLRDFYRQVASPLLADVKFAYPKKQVKAESLTKHQFRRYYLGSESVVAGLVEPEVTELTPTVGAFCGNDQLGRKYMEIVPKAPVPLLKEHYLPLERLWAFLTVRQLLDERDARDADDKLPAPDKRALDIALKYSFVTPLTSLVVVKPNATDAIDAESVHKQNQDVGYSSLLSANYASFAARPMFSSVGFAGAPVRTSLSSTKSTYRGLPQAQYSSFSRLPIPMNAFGLQMYRQTGAADMADTLDAGAPVSTTLLVAPSTPAALTSAPTTAAADPLEKYHLSDFVWVSLLLRPGEDAIHLKTNTTDETLKLSKDDVAPKPASGTDAECSNALAGTGAGSCVYLTRCDAARAIATAQYLGSYCSVDGFAGVCCPKASVDVGKTD
ncbi:inter-alpha-trypsin inhibitor heavy chain H4-like isoform X1 [Ostrinia furnacalis]|uniref:inter-alpha-trypsin inhibitor heavy chain H4-like isoform X1 n=2 Tax=Ostrinia furnacalis TaxID=93504 RepID=UPI00103F83C7|nr:inter-alpha-trypsin inhibitor heavy chain H4-like isoform X1 [Ostrinia furnacalis]